MKKSEFVNKIKGIVKELHQKKKQPSNLETPSPSRFDMIVRFPEMIPVLVDLMTNDFELFLEDIYWVAPKPTTFKIMLINNQFYFLIYGNRSWTAQVEGKKYYLNEVRDAELAAESISRILKYGKVSNKSIDSSEKISKETGASKEEVSSLPKEETNNKEPK